VHQYSDPAALGSITKIMVQGTLRSNSINKDSASVFVLKRRARKGKTMTTPVKDLQTVTSQGESTDKLIAGVVFHEVTTHPDERGMLCEIFDPRWGWHPDPLIYCYCFTVRPGMIKGWAYHKKHEDRYFILFGEVEVVLYDDRPDSPTYKLVSKIVLSEFRRRLMNIPIGVWHASRNLGSKDVVGLNFPTMQYDHANPDKYRLPLDTDYIPHKFDNPRGW
jgi:dTDP-4-dehydrorhamnose 3,5-epimerase